MNRVHFYGFNNITGSYRTYGSMIETFAADAMPVGWEWGDEAAYDREFIAQQDRYSLVQMYDKHGDEIEVVMLDGEPVGVLDNPHIGLGDLKQYETPDQTALREGAEDAARELNTWRTPANDIWHRIARRRA